MNRVSRSSGSTSLMLLIVAGLYHPASAQQKDDAKASTGAPVIALQTVYLTEPVGAVHQISIRGEIGGAVRVTLDRNTCTLTQFGDRGVCTEIASKTIPVEMKRVRLPDPTGQGRRLYRLDGKLEPANARFFLVIPRRRSQPHRLVVNLNNDRRRVLTLEAIPEPARVKPELCSKATYSAKRIDGKVVISAEGKHRTSGWKVAFEQLPIRIFPPQFRLVCFPPQEAAAQVVTPFRTDVSFATNQAVRQVIVHDAEGQHKVPVREAK